MRNVERNSASKESRLEIVSTRLPASVGLARRDGETTSPAHLALIEPDRQCLLAGAIGVRSAAWAMRAHDGSSA
jgi:hypothetical protein